MAGGRGTRYGIATPGHRDTTSRVPRGRRILPRHMTTATATPDALTDGLPAYSVPQLVGRLSCSLWELTALLARRPDLARRVFR